MKKAVNKKEIACGNHEFSLTPTRADLYFKTQVALSFCDSKAHPKPKGKKKSGVEVNCLCYPIFNKDGSYATNTFILPDEKQNYMENQARYKEEHEYRINEGNHEKTQMLFPRPKTKHNHCNVCRSSYEDYRDHIKSESHKVNIRKSLFNKSIKQMEGKYNTINEGRNYKSKICSITETTQNGSLQDQELTNLGAPSKRVKRDCSFVPPICYSIPPLSMVQSDMQAFSTFPQQNLNQQGPLSYVPFVYPQFSMLNQNQLFSMLQANMFRQVCLNSQMAHSMFLGFPNMFFNGIQDARTQQNIFNVPTAAQRGLVNNS